MWICEFWNFDILILALNDFFMYNSLYFGGGVISPNFDPKNMILTYIVDFSWK